MCVRLDLSFRTDLIKIERVPLLLCVLSSASVDVSGEKAIAELRQDRKAADWRSWAVTGERVYSSPPSKSARLRAGRPSFYFLVC